MNDTDSSNPETENNSKKWTPSTAEELLETVLYEFRTPIMVIKGYAMLLANEEQMEVHPQALAGISHATERLELLLNDLADSYGQLIRKPNL